MSRRTAVYCRISSDPSGRALGVDRQREECIELVTRRGWNLVATLQDNDVSAYSGKARPAYDQLMALVRAETVDVIVAWHPDRLHRSPAELEVFITSLDQHHVDVETVRAGAWDLSTPSGRLITRQLGTVARYESEQKSDRVRAALAQRARTGATHGRATYGWRRVVDPETGRATEVLDDAEAAVVRRIAARLIAGESLRSITAKLNAEEVPTPLAAARAAQPLREDDTRRPASQAWLKGMVRAVVVRPRNAGRRVHRGQVVGTGTWPPILESGTYDQVMALLSDPVRRTSTGTAAAHLLSGLARCGVCGGPIRATINRSVPSYACHEKRCVSRNRRDVDELVTGIVLARLSAPDASVFLSSGSTGPMVKARQDVSELQACLDLAADQYADGDLDARSYLRIVERLRPRLAAAKVAANRVEDAPLFAELVGAGEGKAQAVWDSLPLSTRRGVVSALLEVRILRAKQGARVFDPTNIEITWRQM